MAATKPKLILVVGPTAVGKTALALELAQRLDGEIVNADSQQVYRYMDIGTGKPSASERQQVRHHMIDIVNPDEEFNAALYRRQAAEAIEQICRRGKRAIVCGGTGLYVKALTRGLFTGPVREPEIRQRLAQEIAREGLATLYQRLVQIDESVPSTIHPNDRQRIIRALEVYEQTGKPMSKWQKEHGFHENPYQVLKIGLQRERAELYDQINKRCERMIEEGLVEEVRGLVSRGFGLHLKPLRSVGYRQIGAFISGEIGLADALSQMKQETRHLAKRQITWFRRDSEIRWYHPEKHNEDIFESASDFLQ